jgi:ATP-binding cassette subfamily B protein
MTTGSTLRGIIRDRPGIYAVDVLLQILRGGIPLIPGLLVAQALDWLSAKPMLSPGLWLIFGLLIGAALARVTVLLTTMSVDALITSHSSSLLRRKVFRSVLSKPGAEPLSLSAGDVVGRLSTDAQAVSDLLTFTLMMIGSAFQALVAVSLMLFINAQITLAVFIPLAAAGLLINTASRKVKELHHLNRLADGEVGSFLGEVFGAVQAIQLAGACSPVIKRFERLNAARRARTLHSLVFTDVFLGSTWGNTANLATGVVLLLAAQGMKDGSFSIGDLALFIAYLGWIADFTSVFSQNFALYRHASVALQRLEGVAPGENQLPSLAAAAPDLGAIAMIAASEGERRIPLATLEVCRLNYLYPGTRNGVQNVSFAIRRGSFAVVTGRLGSGKTTLLRTILGLLPKQSGILLWNGQEITHPGEFFVPPHSAYTPQVPRLTSDTVENNILLGLEVGSGVLDEAIHAAVLERDLTTLSDGLQTAVGPRGMRLSGGQVQRVAAARMFVRDPELLVFDDLSSALDVETERQLWERLAATPGRTCLVVSHRRAVLERADQVIVMREGLVEAQGTLTEVLQNSEEMVRLWRAESDLSAAANPEVK